MKKFKLRQKILKVTYLAKSKFKHYFIASSTDSAEVRKKHKRIAALFCGSFVILLIIAAIIGDSVDSSSPKTLTSNNAGLKSTNQVEGKPAKKVDIKKLANGATHEQVWFEGAAQELEKIKQQQQASSKAQGKLQEYIKKDSLTQSELTKRLADFEKQISTKYEKQLTEQLAAKLKEQNKTAANLFNSNIDRVEILKKAKIKKIGDYIPAGSYVEAQMISGIDAGVGISSGADPRQVLLRITGKLISAGYGKDYLTTSKLMGCVVQCQAVGDLSSEKAYLKPVVMTCARSEESVIEIPVKGYVTSKGKVGIRGDVISREGDLVANSFLSGLVGGIGNTASQLYQPNFALSDGMAVKQNNSIKSVLGTSFGSGLSESSGKLSDYFIKRAEQYQPVISIDEGVGVDLVFQEGFSLNEEEVGNARP